MNDATSVTQKEFRSIPTGLAGYTEDNAPSMQQLVEAVKVFEIPLDPSGDASKGPGVLIYDSNSHAIFCSPSSRVSTSGEESGSETNSPLAQCYNNPLEVSSDDKVDCLESDIGDLLGLHELGTTLQRSNCVADSLNSLSEFLHKANSTSSTESETNIPVAQNSQDEKLTSQETDEREMVDLLDEIRKLGGTLARVNNVSESLDLLKKFLPQGSSTSSTIPEKGIELDTRTKSNDVYVSLLELNDLLQKSTHVESRSSRSGKTRRNKAEQDKKPEKEKIHRKGSSRSGVFVDGKLRRQSSAKTKEKNVAPRNSNSDEINASVNMREKGISSSAQNNSAKPDSSSVSAIECDQLLANLQALGH